MPHLPTTRTRARWLHGARFRLLASSPSPQQLAARRSSDFRSELGLGLYERVDVPESLVPMLQQLRGGLGQQRLEVAVERLVERRGGSVIVGASASLRLRH